MKKFVPILLGLMAALLPFTTHALLPAFPSISAYIHVLPNKMLMVLSAGYIGLLVGLLIFGPLSDTYGRKRILMVGSIFYVVSSLLCGLSHNSFSMILLLFFQSFGGAAILISAYAIARDLFFNKDLTDTLASIAMIIMCVPLVAPFVGTALIVHDHWQNIFYFLAACGSLISVMAFSLTETKTASLQALTLAGVVEQYMQHFKNKLFMKQALCIGCAMGIMFSFIGSSSIVYINFFGISTLFFSYIFATMGLSIFLANYCLKKLKNNYSLATIQRGAISLTFFGCFANLLCVTWQPNNWILFSSIMFFILFGVSLTSSTLMSNALNAIKNNVASAASLIQLSRACIAMLTGFSMSFFLHGNIATLIYQQLILAIIMGALIFPNKSASLSAVIATVTKPS